MHNHDFDEGKSVDKGSILLVIFILSLILALCLAACNPEKQLSKAYGKVAADAPAPKPENKNKLLPYFALNFPLNVKTETKTEYIKGDTETVIDSAALQEAKDESERLKKYLKNLDTTKCPINVDSVLKVIERIKTNYAKAVARVDSLKTEINSLQTDRVQLEKNQLDIATLLKEIIGKDAVIEGYKKEKEKSDAKVAAKNKTIWILSGILLLLLAILGVGLYFKLKKAPAKFLGI